ncbi:MAG: lamin tail domain-containing protein, partial [Flavobacteriaceae bacterium]|nr:lamin tail domain-containing protein [Flavobacteriaceae bacterium]
MNLIRLCCFLLFTQIYSQDIRINELVASNSIFTDEDGDTPDWIELYNYGSTPVSLINWSISDEEDDTNPWVFPDVTLNEDEYMLLWASNKDRGQL